MIRHPSSPRSSIRRRILAEPVTGALLLVVAGILSFSSNSEFLLAQPAIGVETSTDILTMRMYGWLYPLADDHGVPLYRWEQEYQEYTSGLPHGVWHSRYLTPSGSIAAADQVVWGQGVVQRYGYTRHALEESSQVERQGNRLVYTRQVGSRIDHAEESYSENFTAGPGVIPMIQRHWDELAGGAPIEIRYGILDQMKSYAFELRHDPGHPRNGPSAVVIRMRLSNSFLRMFIDPIYLVFSSDGRIFRALIGRMLPVAMDTGSPRPVDAALIVSLSDSP